MEIQTQELTEIKSQISIVELQAMQLEVKNQEDMDNATETLKTVHQAEKYIIEKKEAITRPLMSSLAQIRDLFRPLESSLTGAKALIKSKMLEWTIAEEERIEKEKARIAARVEKGTMKAETAAGKLEKVGEVSKSGVRTVKKVRIINEDVIPRTYMMPNMPKITEDIIRHGIVILGVETYEEKSIVAR